ncbi:hypothetical protein [Kribbella sp. NPDC050459]|uniref:hypothetical protein n=1 Tax=Kribbella sp. NPDC050459 TaxID=3155785 RepID=UPI0034113BA0
MSTTAQGGPEPDEQDRHDDNDEHDDNRGPGDGGGRKVFVTVVAPNNAAREFPVQLHERVDKLAREAVRVFVRAQEMEPMECSLALVVDGAARTLDDAARLEETGVHEHSRLVLVPKQPKTDG